VTTSHLTIRTAAVPDPVELERWRALLVSIHAPRAGRDSGHRDGHHINCLHAS